MIESVHESEPAATLLNPQDFIITRKRKLYRFALFQNSPICFETEDWINTPAPRVMELGAGTGMFSLALAENDPTTQYLAVDVKADRLQYGARQAATRQVGNLQFLRARADQLPELLTPGSLQSIWITFPDPYPKPHAAKNRLLYSRFLTIYSELLSSDGSLYFKTDSKDLFEWALEQLVESKWVITELSFDLHESDLPEQYKIKTTFEARYLKEGRTINFLRAVPPR